MPKDLWTKLTVAGATLLLAGLLAACGGNDSEGSSGSGTAVPPAGNSTATPAPLEGSSPPTVVIDPVPGTGASGPPPAPPAFEEPPATTASSNGQTVETGIGTFCWTMLCVDKIGVPTRGTLDVMRGDVVTVTIPPNAPALREAAVNAYEALNAQLLEDGSQIWPYPGAPGEPVTYEITAGNVEVPVDLQPGLYVLAVSMYFEQGDVVYGVLLNVQ